MVDAMVVVHASRKRGFAPTQRMLSALILARREAQSKSLVAKMQPIRISAIAWFEFARFARTPTERLAREESDEVSHRPRHRTVADEAVRLMNAYRKADDVCERSLGSLNAGECPGCGLRISHPQRMADAFIVATAEVERVATLYSYDSGIHEFGKHLKHCEVGPSRGKRSAGSQTDPAAGLAHIQAIKPIDLRR